MGSFGKLGAGLAIREAGGEAAHRSGDKLLRAVHTYDDERKRIVSCREILDRTPRHAPGASIQGPAGRAVVPLDGVVVEARSPVGGGGFDGQLDAGREGFKPEARRGGDRQRGWGSRHQREGSGYHGNQGAYKHNLLLEGTLQSAWFHTWFAHQRLGISAPPAAVTTLIALILICDGAVEAALDKAGSSTDGTVPCFTVWMVDNKWTQFGVDLFESLDILFAVVDHILQ